MRIVIQRVTKASVSVENQTIARSGPGLLLFVAVGPQDDASLSRRMAQKCAQLRLFASAGGRFDRSLLDAGAEALVVSQFTLLADVRRGRRPSFENAAPPELAAPLVACFEDELRRLGLTVGSGRFGAMMQVESVNDGPVTIILDSKDLDRPRHGRP